jgi:hypothetical protein
MDEDILAMLLTAMVLFVPVAGLTLRFALKPMVDSIARLMEARVRGAGADVLEKRLALLEQELQSVRGELTRIVERSDFYDRLTLERQIDRMKERAPVDGARVLTPR